MALNCHNDTDVCINVARLIANYYTRVRIITLGDGTS